jgi:hypothetical protein
LKPQRCFWRRWGADMYGEDETSLSRRYLRELFTWEAEGAVLLGGWAVHLLVDEGFREATGRSYIGSSDIDVGFHFDEGSTREDLEESSFSRVFRRLSSSGFRGQSFRLYKDFDLAGHRELTPDEAASMLPFEVSRLYIDLVVDRIPASFSDVFGFIPIDEPLLEYAFSDGLVRDISWEGVDLRVVEPSLLLGMKLNSVGTRTRDHKRIKDIADIFALAWYSGEDLDDLKGDLGLWLSPGLIRGVVWGFSRDDVSVVSGMIGVDAGVMRVVFSELRS